MISVSQAKQILSSHRVKGRIVRVGLKEALGKILVDDVYSPMDVPSFDNSAMDGYAVCLNGNSTTWKIKGMVQAGDKEIIRLKPGDAARIFTGAKIPEGTDGVIPQELIEKIGDQRIAFNGDEMNFRNNIRLKGSQCRMGEKILEKGTKLNPGMIGLLASVGISEIRCFCPPRVAIIVTGNELQEIDQLLERGQIYNSNGPMLTAFLKQVGVEKISNFLTLDHKEKIQETIIKALWTNDVLILSGGISVGDYDFVRESLANVGVKELFYKVKQRPGKPMLVGKKGEKMVFALPGNPASVLSCFIQYVKPWIKDFLGNERVWQEDDRLPLAEDVFKVHGLTVFMKARKEGQNLRLLSGQESFNLRSFGTADHLVELEEDLEFVQKGTLVKVYDLN